AFSPDRKALATASGGAQVRVWDVGTGKLSSQGTWPVSVIGALAFGPGSRRLAGAGFEESVIYLADAKTGKILLGLQGHRAAIRSLAFSADGRLLASGDHSGTVRLWEVATGSSRGALGGPLAGPRGPILSLAFSPDGKYLA